MKKFFVLGLALSLLTGAVVVNSEASRSAYHTYLTQKAKQNGQYRRYTEGNTQRRTAITRHPRRAHSGYTTYSRQNLLYPTYNKRHVYSGTKSTRNSDLPLRTVSARNGIYRNYAENTGGYFRRIQELNIPMQSFENETMSINFPTAWDGTFSGDEFKPNTNSNMSFRIKKFDGICGQRNFAACANSIVRTENRLNNQELLRDYVHRIHRTSGKFDNFLGEKTKAGFYEESIVTRRQKNQEFVAQRVVEGENGDAYYLEMVAPEKQTTFAIPLAKQVFESFRVIR